MLAVVHACKVWRCYFEGAEFKVLTDHQPNTFFQTQPILSRRQARWFEFLQQFQLNWEFRPGIDNPADTLSRPAVDAPKLFVIGTARKNANHRILHTK
jgi:hypothetical protein